MISSFTGKYHFLSNFDETPVELPWLPEYVFPSAEHAFHACKFTNAKDVMRIRSAGTPLDAKRLGRALRGIRPDWEQVKRRMMLEVELAKFCGNESLGWKLLETGSELLIEGNNHGDEYWGAIVGGKSTVQWGSESGRVLHGENWLGRILMMVRQIIPT